MDASDEKKRELEPKDQITVALKEYDSLRNQVDQSMSYARDLYKAMGLALAGLCIAGRADATVYAAVISAPVLLLALLASAAHSHQVLLV